MEQLCRICSKYKPKAAFTEKSLSLHTCKTCSKMPRPRTEERNQLDEIFDLLTQTRISKKDTIRLEELAGSTIEKVARHASLLLEVAMVKPYKKGRNIFLEERYPDLLSKMEEVGLIYPQP